MQSIAETKTITLCANRTEREKHLSTALPFMAQNFENVLANSHMIDKGKKKKAIGKRRELVTMVTWMEAWVLLSSLRLGT